jgi:hypothetical protein
MVRNRRLLRDWERRLDAIDPSQVQLLGGHHD